MYSVYSLKSGNTLEDTIKHLEFTPEEFEYMMKQSLLVSELPDTCNVILMDNTTQPISSIQITNEENLTVALI